MSESTENNQSQQLSDSALSQNIYKLDGKVPIITALAIGLQHVLAMFLSNVVPIILIAGAATMNGSKIPPNIMTQLIQTLCL